MAKPYVILSEIEDTLTSEFVHGTDNHCHLVSAADFDAGGGFVRIETVAGDHWCLYEYTGITTNDLTGLTPCTLGNVESDAAYTFPAGAIVFRVVAPEDVNERIMGPASATDGAVFYANGTTGKLAAQEAGFVWDATNKLLTVTKAAIGATQGDYGLVLVNTTAAANGAQQWSPPVRWKGYGWETAVGSSDAVEFRSFVRPIQGTAVSGGLDFQASLNGAAYVDLVTILSDGKVGIGTIAPTVKFEVVGGNITATAAASAAGEINILAGTGTSLRANLNLQGRNTAGTLDLYTFQLRPDLSPKDFVMSVYDAEGDAWHALTAYAYVGNSCNWQGNAMLNIGKLAVGTATVPSGGGATVLVFAQTTDPTGMGSNTAGIFAKDNGGTAQMYKINEAGTVSAIG